jgi:putative tricarboxylic transport membrane protein
VLALVLGDKAEDAFRQSMLLSQGDLGIMFSNGLVGGITALALVMLFWPVISKLLAFVRKPKQQEFAAERPVD